MAAAEPGIPLHLRADVGRGEVDVAADSSAGGEGRAHPHPARLLTLQQPQPCPAVEAGLVSESAKMPYSSVFSPRGAVVAGLYCAHVAVCPVGARRRCRALGGGICRSDT